MRTITHCPACQTQFFVTEEQLNKHGGKVRCGQCLHVFNAKSQFILTDLPHQVPAEPPPAPPFEQDNISVDISPTSELGANTQQKTQQNISQITPQSAPQNAPPNETEWPSIHDDLLTVDNDFDDLSLEQPIEFSHTFNDEQETEIVELSVSSYEIEAFAAETSKDVTARLKSRIVHDVDDTILIEDSDFDDIIDEEYEESSNNASGLNEITKLTSIADNQANYFNDLAKLAKRNTKKSHHWLWLIGAITLTLIVIAQSLYFLRNEIAIHYPNFKPYLVEACKLLGCSVNLPKQIEFIVIDDSDMQEDTTHAGLMHFSSTLVNKADFHQAFPNLELTLTSADDKPLLRKIFKPSEYLPADTNISDGFKPDDEVKIKLSITTQGINVSGYRVFVSY